jgi:hypothetical protein
MKTEKEIFKNKKTGKLYDVCTSDDIINTTNANDGQRMIIYTDGEKFFVREIVEFCEKFERVN